FLMSTSFGPSSSPPPWYSVSVCGLPRPRAASLMTLPPSGCFCRVTTRLIVFLATSSSRSPTVCGGAAQAAEEHTHTAQPKRMFVFIDIALFCRGARDGCHLPMPRPILRLHNAHSLFSAL